MTSMATPSVTIILPTHNRVALLPRAITSVLSQDYDDLQLIVVDDASTDDTQAVVRQVEDDRIRYIRLADNQGAVAARNAGISAAQSEFIGFQDSDDEWLPGKLKKQMLVFRKGGPSVDIVYCGFQRVSGQSVVEVPGPHIGATSGDLSRTILYENFVTTQSLILRRRCLENVGMFFEDLPRFQDWELVIRLAQQYRFHFVNEPLVKVYDTPGNITSDPEAGARALRMILERHHAKIGSDRRAHANFLRLLGLYECLAGSSMEARKLFLTSLRLEPQSLKTWGAALLSLLGTGAIRSALGFRSNLRTRALRNGSN